MNEKIREFIKKQTCASICCSDENGTPYCFNCFYAFDSENGLLYFKSSDETYHFSCIKKNARISGTILPDKLNKLLVIGIQLLGDLLPPQHPMSKNSYIKYHKKYPMALAMQGEVFTIRINHVKMTDSWLGIGKKINWSRESTEIQP